MKNLGKRLVVATLAAGLSLPVAALAADEIQQKLDALQKEITDLKAQVKKTDDKSLEKWLTIGGDYRFRVDSLKGQMKSYVDVNSTFANAQNTMQSNYFNSAAPGAAYWQASLGQMMTFSNAMKQVKTVGAAQQFVGNNAPMLGALQNFAVQVPSQTVKNDTLYTNRFGLDLHAKVVQGVTATVRLLAYKTFGSSDDNSVTGSGGTPFFADRVGVFDGTMGHIPSSDYLGVDRAYVTWANIYDSGAWFSVGRRPSSNWMPEHLRLNNERPGNGGVPSLMVDYAYDGMTLGWAPDIEKLPGAYAKICYGRGFDSGYDSGEHASGNSVKDMDMLGFAVVPYETEPFMIQMQYNHAFNVIDFPVMKDTYFGDTGPSTNLGEMDWIGLNVFSTLKKVGPGTLNTFMSTALSHTNPNNNVSANAGFQGLMTGEFFQPEKPENHTGWSALVGFRYDLPTNTKLGFEYNHGSKYWITMSPAADDIWTSKYGTRGDVYETYVIQELNLKPIASYFAKAFFKVGYQYYNFEYTNSNNWVGAPQKISDLTGTEMQMLAPLKNAQNIYGTFEVKF